MPTQTNLNTSPYFDDFDETKDFYKVLFRPGVAVQVRELNTLQSILQKQIERFGDNIFKRGTIVDGCQFLFHDAMPFIKIEDNDTEGFSVNVANLENKILKNESNGLKAYVITSKTGFESADPDLNTLYVRYINSGDNNETESYANADVLTVTDTNNSIFGVTVGDGSSGFSNADFAIFLSAIEIQNTTGGTLLSTNFSVGETITQSTTSAKANVVSINTTANSESIVLQLRPLSNNLANGLNSNAWTFSTGYTITGGTSGATANVVGIVGNSAAGSVITDGAGIITEIDISVGGEGYYVEPYSAVASSNNAGNTTAIGLLDLTAKNYHSKITVATVTNSVNTAYGFTISDGVIYQKGYFDRVEQQLIIVDDYANTPHEKVVGFNTIESIVNSNSDSTLLDNSTGTRNENAPGANRLVLTPTLVVLDKSDAQANDNFFGIVEFSNGKPFKQITTTQYNKLNDEIAKRTKEESGDYVLDLFNLNTISPSAVADEATQFNFVVDPGLAYIDGRRVQSVATYTDAINKATNTAIIAGSSVDIDYGNYINIKELGGSFKFSLGDIVSLRDTANTYLTSYFGSAISSGPGTEIGQARMRSLTYVDGEQGSPIAKYRLYLFDIRMDAGKNFKDTRAVFYNGSNKGVADIVLTTDTSGSTIAVLQDNNKSKLLFPTKVNATKTLVPNGSSANVVYVSRTSDNTVSISNTGAGGNTARSMTITVTAPNYFPYAGSLSDAEKRDIVIIPQSNTQTANAAGTVATTSGQSNITGTSTDFVTAFSAGDYVKVANSTASEIHRIVAVVNSTVMTSANNFGNTFSSSNVALYFPQNVPIPFASRTTRTASVSGNTTLYIGLGVSLLGTGPTATVYYNKKLSAAANAVVKTTQRLNYVKVRANTHTANTVGPWCLGHSDIFRLRNVYVAEDVNVNTNSTNITNEFYIDHNQNPDFYDVGYLVKKPTSDYSISANAVLLAEFDLFTKTANGVVCINSYRVDDAISLANADSIASNSTINTIELPEVFGPRGDYFDLRDQIDFRLYSSNTANVSATAAGATTNPVDPTSSARFDVTTDKNFPAPQEDIFFDVEYYLPRTDRVILNSNGDFVVLTGTPGEVAYIPPEPNDAMTINVIKIPPYPSIPNILSANTILLADTKVANELYTRRRMETYTIIPTINKDNVYLEQPRGYTMADIGSLERRIQALEYYVSLNQLETNVKNQVITSSNDPTVDRFKFGFFVDSFSNTSYSDLNNPEYSATIFDGELTAKQKQINIKFVPNNSIHVTLPYNEYSLIKQLNATDGAVVANTANVVTVIQQSTVNVGVYTSITNYTANASTYDIKDFVFSANSGSAILYFDARNANDRYEIFQNTSPNFDYTQMSPTYTSESCVVLSASDRLALSAAKALLNYGDWSLALRPDFTRHTGPAELGSPSNFWVRHVGKIAWTHSPTNGRYYKIAIRKGSIASCYYLSYPADANTVVTSNTNINGTTIYRGNFESITPREFNSLEMTNLININNVTYLLNQQKVSIVCTGLKPSTRHEFYMEEILKTSKCKQVGKELGANLITDSYGRLVFDFYYDTGLPNTTTYTDFIQQQNNWTLLSGLKKLLVKNADSSSIAENVISFSSNPKSLIDALKVNSSQFGIINKII